MALAGTIGMLDYLTAEQVQRLHPYLGGDRNVRRVLGEMEKKGLISSYRLERYKIYHLAKKGRELVNVEKVRKPTLKVPHFLMRNEVYIHFQPTQWRPEPTIMWGLHTIMPDAAFQTKDGRKYILEVDVTQSMAVNKKKIEVYREMRAKTVLYVTTSQYRQKTLSALLEPIEGIALTVKDMN